jgi:transposase
MEFTEFIRDLLGISSDFDVVKIEKEEENKRIFIHLKYLPTRYQKDNNFYTFYDKAPERTWQHLSWFEYKCFIKCALPRYVNSESKVVTIDIDFAPKLKGYTNKFSSNVIKFLKEIRVQNTVAKLLNTTPYIVRSIMESAVEKALLERGFVKDFKNVSLDEKAYKPGHEYATILIDSDKECVLNLVEGRKEKSVKVLFFELNEQEQQPQIELINIDMWKPFMNAMQEISPYALQVHDKFHLVKKLSDAIDKTRKKEIKESDLLIKQKYTVLKNQENRTENQQKAFELLKQANLKTAQAWAIRENFKTIFSSNHWSDKLIQYKCWIKDAIETNLEYINEVIKTFQNHEKGIHNAIITDTTSGKHENLNGKIQSVLAKARGFLNFDRFKINVMFYFGNLRFTH